MDLRAKKKFTPDEAKQREKERVKSWISEKLNDCILSTAIKVVLHVFHESRIHRNTAGYRIFRCQIYKIKIKIKIKKFRGVSDVGRI